MTAAPGGNTRWAMLALLFAVRTGLGFQFQTVGSVADPLSAELRLSYAEVGTLIGIFFLPGLVLAIPAGYAGRYVSDKVLVALGMLALALGGGLCAVAQDFGVLALGRVLCGAGFVVGSLFMTKMTVDWFAGKEIATAMALLVMSWPFGIAMGQVGHGWLAATVGWRGAFTAAAIYCLAGAAVMLAYRPPPGLAVVGKAISATLTRREWTLVLIASTVWSSFNAAYIVYLSFAPRVLVAGGLGAVEAATVISLASWVMIVSATIFGQIADRTGKSDVILYSCLVVAMLSLALLRNTGFAMPLTLAFGLLGMAPAGLIMALTGQAMAPERRAFGMGVFLTGYFLLQAPAPAIAGWLYDKSGDPFWPILFAIALFGLTAAANLAFRVARSRWPA